MAGTVDLMQRCYSGLETRQDMLLFNPALPEEVNSLAFNILYRRHWLQVTINKDSMRIASREGAASPIRIGLGETIHELQSGLSVELELKR